ncbi:MAG TPA: polyprenyl synthetase family protein [Euzebyales bacterium]|nr:polyprenyl synthetase family protein [Euzebyales bacterium]
MVDTSSAVDLTVDPLRVVSEPVNALLTEFLGARERQLTDLDPRLAPIVRAVNQLVLTGGKRMRPAFVYWGYRAGGAPHTDTIWHTAAAFELLQSFALIHDDVMDRSTRRRGRPAVHVALAAHHRAAGLRGDGDWFGVGAAILAGDLAFVWADELFDAAPLDTLDRERARRVFTDLRTELMAGQYLDLVVAATTDAQPEQAQTVALLKAGRYTVTRPLQLGAAIAGVDPVLDAALVGYGDAVGVAFQLRDDVLGLFGDPGDTGKGVLDDLRQGKRTLLMLTALDLADRTQRDVLTAALGNPDVDERAANDVRTVVTECGALETIERQVGRHHARALQAIATVDPPARGALALLADRALFRDA